MVRREYTYLQRNMTVNGSFQYMIMGLALSSSILSASLPYSSVFMAKRNILAAGSDCRFVKKLLSVTAVVFGLNRRLEKVRHFTFHYLKRGYKKWKNKLNFYWLKITRVMYF